MLILLLFILLLTISLNNKKDDGVNQSRLGIIYLINCINIIYKYYYINYLQKGLGILGGLYNINSINTAFTFLIILISIIILNLTGFYTRKNWKTKNLTMHKLLIKKLNLIWNILNNKGEQYNIIEYTIIILFIMAGSILLITSNDLISLYISIELQSYGLYILCSTYRNSENAISSGLTYFLLGGLSSCFILLGIGLIYNYTGTTTLENIYIITDISRIENIVTTLKSYGIMLITVGLLFKISAAPFHFWSPDVYDGIPTIVTTFVAIIPKISILIILSYIFHYTYSNSSLFEYNWTTNIILSSLLSLILGTVLGLRQIRIKRLLAYSTISHLGFILLSLTINSVESIESFIFYLIQYSLTNLNAFLIILSIGYTLFFYIDKDKTNKNLLDKNNSPIQLISQLKGYIYINPLLALSFALTLYSFAGIPPLVGFFGKLKVLSSALEEGYYFMAIIAIITSVIGAAYYLYIINRMFFEKNPYINKSNIDFLNNNEGTNYSNSGVSLTSALSINISIFTLITVSFMFTPNSILQMSRLLSLNYFAGF